MHRSMTDRYYAFRYELHGVEPNIEARLLAIQSKAELYGCFGWVQSATASIVGEARCGKKSGPILKTWLRDTQEVPLAQADFHDYADTKIRYHFSHFKILPVERVTCFDQAPHKCGDAAPREKEEL